MKQALIEPTKTGRPRDFDVDEALNKAMLLFWEHGYETTSMTLLSKKMNMNAPSIYAAFGDKKSLFLRALDLYVGPIDDIEAFINQSTSAFEAVDQMLKQSAIRFTSKATPNGCMLASATASASPAAYDVKVVASKIRAKIELLLKNRIKLDIKNKILPISFSAEALAGLTISTIQGMSVLARDGASRKKILSIAQAAMLAWTIHGSNLKQSAKVNRNF